MLLESEERFRCLAEAASDAVCIAEGGRVVSANSAFSELFRYDPSELAGMRIESFFAPGSRGAVAEATAEGRDLHREFVGLRRDGSRFPVFVRGRTTRFQGRVVRVITISDLTVHKREAILEERRRVARDLHDGLAHELAFILSALSTSDVGSEAGAHVSRAAERALDEARRAISVLSAAHPESFSDALLHTAEELTARHNLRLLADVDASVTAPVDAVEHLLRIVREAITNAARHSGATRVVLRCWRDEELHLVVSDDGTGFDPAAVTSGFGLHSMQSRAQTIGGTLSIRSRISEGTSVEVTAP